MSALAGIVRFDGGPADAGAAGRLIDSVEHRGLDWRAVWSDGSAALAFRWHRTGRTQPIDQQPLVDRLGSGSAVAIVFDGRLDNRRDLASLLPVDDAPSVPDAAIVLAAYRRFGTDVVARLLAILRSRFGMPESGASSSRAIPRGVRSMSYAVVSGGVAFATEPRQLLDRVRLTAAPTSAFSVSA